MHLSMNNRLSSLGLESWDLGGRLFFFHCLVPLVGMAVPELRNLVAQYMRDSDLVGTMLNSLPLHTLFQDTSLLTLRGDPNHNVNIFAEAIGLGAPAHLIVDEQSVHELISFVARIRMIRKHR